MARSPYSGTALLCSFLFAYACGGPASSASGNTVDKSCPGGCPTGQKCTALLVAGVATPRCTRDGDVPPGETCGGGLVDDCAAGSLCGTNGVVDSGPVPLSSIGVCQPYCATDADCS